MTEEQEEGGRKDEEDEERRGRLSIALTNCGDVLERQLFDAIFWSVKGIIIIAILISQEEAKHRLSLPCLPRLCHRRQFKRPGGGRWVIVNLGSSLPSPGFLDLQSRLSEVVSILELGSTWLLPTKVLPSAHSWGIC